MRRRDFETTPDLYCLVIVDGKSRKFVVKQYNNSFHIRGSYLIHSQRPCKRITDIYGSRDYQEKAVRQNRFFTCARDSVLPLTIVFICTALHYYKHAVTTAVNQSIGHREQVRKISHFSEFGNVQENKNETLPAIHLFHSNYFLIIVFCFKVRF